MEIYNVMYCKMGEKYCYKKIDNWNYVILCVFLYVVFEVCFVGINFVE